MTTCIDCKNNVNGFCQICRESSGTLKKISNRQISCGYKNKDIGYDFTNISQDSELKKEIEALKNRVKDLEEAQLSVRR